MSGGGAGRNAIMDLQPTSVTVLMNLKMLSSRATSEGLSVNAEKSASQVTVATADGVAKMEADAEGNSNSEGWSQPLQQTGNLTRRARKAKVAAERETQQDLNVTELMEAQAPLLALV